MKTKKQDSQPVVEDEKKKLATRGWVAIYGEKSVVYQRAVRCGGYTAGRQYPVAEK